MAPRPTSSSASPASIVLCIVLAIAGCATGSDTAEPTGVDAGIGGSDAGPADAGRPDATPIYCAAEPCFPGVLCGEIVDGFACGPCPDGLEGDGISCTEIDSCAAAPCFLGVSCTDLAAPEDGFACGECPTGFFGNGIICTDIDACEGEPCFPGAACVDNTPPEVGFTCGTCPAGYEGDGLSCNDIDGCENDPCFAGVQCDDNAAPQTGFTCGGCPPGHVGNGVSCDLLCDPISPISCGGLIASNNGGVGSTDQIDNWACSIFSLVGSEVIYTFVPEASGIATATLTGLTADVDLLVIEDAASGGLCDGADNSLCVPGGASHNTGLNDEEARWNALAGKTYYIIVDGFTETAGDFTLRVNTATEDVLLQEVAYGVDDYVEVRNHGACTVDYAGLTLMHKASLETAAHLFSFPASSNVGPGQVLRLVESSSGPYLSNEIDAGVSFLDIPADAGFTALCNGTCDTATCSNLQDYVERDDDPNDTVVPGGPACAAFSPAPVDAAGQTGDSALHRAAFDGAVSGFTAGDWVFAPSSRN